ncbi:hypothetical protein DRE_05219 [Drechslerella stenobrocha 248]|uniref:Histidine acid phosphatase n=1 Tax=Drechslerella stenobrocha 248 TaxID=1043628 RepID=W7I0C5_9PEZI|nr:hypothetical protein DRE_05219 [Drechslerella stenobrocha 248]
MKVSSVIAGLGLLAEAYAQSSRSPAVTSNGTVLAVFIYHNHCDRTSIYAPDGRWTGGLFGAPGATMCYQDGTYYWNKYFRKSSPLKIWGTSQIYERSYTNAEAPNEPIAVQSAMAFMQGLFKPVDLQSSVTSGENMLESDNSTFMNGPLSGFQYVPITTYRSSDPDAIYTAGDLLDCNNQQVSSSLYFSSDDYREADRESIAFYISLYQPYFAGVFPRTWMTYFYAYKLYDYVNQNRAAENATLLAMPEEDFQRLRLYANRQQFNLYANTTSATSPNWIDPAYNYHRREIGGRALAGKIALMLNNSMQSDRMQNRFNFALGDFDPMLSFFAISNLTSRSDDFYGIPDLGSSMVFEVYTDDPRMRTAQPTTYDVSIKVAFGFRNGTTVDDTLTYWPLFDTDPQGGPPSMPLKQFLTKMDEVKIGNLGTWCTACNSQTEFCRNAIIPQTSNSGSDESQGSTTPAASHRGMAPAVAGVIGAIIMAVIVGIAAAVAFFLFGVGVRREHRRSSVLSNIGRKEKVSSEIELPLSPTAGPMARSFEDDIEYDYGTASTAATKVASPLASPEEAHFKT